MLKTIFTWPSGLSGEQSKITIELPDYEKTEIFEFQWGANGQETLTKLAVFVAAMSPHWKARFADLYDRIHKLENKP